VTVETNDERSSQSATTTTHGAKAGVEIAFEQTSKFSFPGVAEGGFKTSQKFSAEYNWSSAAETRTGKQSSKRVAISVAAKPGYRTTLDVFTRKISANYRYEGDLTFGEAGSTTPVVTPATQALNMSPSTRQPCLGYVVGDASVRNSIMNIGKALEDAGNKDTEPTLPAERRAFLRGWHSFKTEKKECPGFPAGFASAVAFKGTGVGTYDSVGYDEEGQPRNELVACVYQRPLGSVAKRASHRAAAGADDPCQNVPAGGGPIRTSATASGSPGGAAGARRIPPGGTGVLIDARRAEDVDGTPVSDKMIGTDRDEDFSAGSGTFDQVYGGGGDDLVRGGQGQDLIHGDEGDDVLHGGGGFDTVFGDEGSDRILESGGAGSLHGNDGTDTLVADGGDGLTLLGGQGDDRLISRGAGTRALGGGPGDDRYVVEGSGDEALLEMPGQGTDVVATDRSFTVPEDIEEAVATGDRPVSLRSGDGIQALTGNDAANELEGGVGSDRVDGAGGADRILLDPHGFDRASGGGGADDFIPLGTPANANRPASLERPPNRTAHLITDFQPGRGDRIVMRSTVFGDSLTSGRGPVQIVSGRDPMPRQRRGTILFDERTGVVSFDRDGAGPISDKVAVVLPDAETLRRSWLVMRG
jgi:Ca2+-binding RTX toxin-like protein